MAWPHILDAGSLDDPTFDIDATDGVTCLRGTPCSTGTVEGFVRIAHNLLEAEEVDGEILVVQRTDPGWVPLYPACKGLLVAQGSLLSHTSAAARELGLPTIVGMGGELLQRLQTGMHVRMNGNTGEVVILADPADAHHSVAS
jgi:pyruvate,water dikinase